MSKVRIRYLNFYLRITRKKEEYFEFDDPFTLGQLLTHLSKRYGPEFTELILKNDNTLREDSWIMIGSKIANDVNTMLNDDEEIMFSLPLGGG